MELTPLIVGSAVCSDPDAACGREWLETNGLGGYASSTVAGINTRRYHGLLTVAIKPPVARHVLLSKLEETLHIAGSSFGLSANRYPGVVHPRGYQYLREFRLDPFPIFTYGIGDTEVRKTVFMVHSENRTVIQYELTGHREIELELRPLIAFRDYHSLTHRNAELDGRIVEGTGSVAIAPYKGLPVLYLAHDGAEIHATGDWYYNFEYDAERERGLDYREDLFNPLSMRFVLAPGQRFAIIASTEPCAASGADEMRVAELRRRKSLLTKPALNDPVVLRLVAAADQFIVSRAEFQTVIAGYHWFSDWGRDTMIALPGLTLATERGNIAKLILRAFAEVIDQGMLPNRFPDSGEKPEYNAVDATLWFFEAVRSYLAYTGDVEFVVAELYAKLKDILDWHLRGTRHGIHGDLDGLLACGEAGTQLTWMDVKIGDWVVTPRKGKPVEVQALWYNALCILRDLAVLAHDREIQSITTNMAARACENFTRQFWNETTQCLFDVVDGAHRDPAIRPNQIFAVSLHHSMLPQRYARSVVRTVERELLTPMGLRSLSPADPQYRSHYAGGVAGRDSAYHQGTVWPWLMGPFITAYMRVNGRSPESRNRAEQWLHGFEQHLETAGLGQISEVADGSAPHKPGGCIAQAWSVAELLRAAIEDVYAPDNAAARMIDTGSGRG